MIRTMAPETHTISDTLAAWLECDTHPTPLALAEALADRATWGTDPRRPLQPVHPTSPITISALCHIALGLDDAIAEHRVSINHRTQQITQDSVTWSKTTHLFDFLTDWDHISEQHIEAGRVGPSLQQLCARLIKRTTRALLNQLVHDRLLEPLR